MSCDHLPGGRDWARMSNGVTKLHPYCGRCGTIKNISSNRGLKLSHYVTALSRLRKILRERGYRVSEAQIRLITKELSENEDFTDVWWVTFEKQKEIFIETVQKYIRVSRDLIESAVQPK